jgi:hypothetical protein
LRYDKAWWRKKKSASAPVLARDGVNSQKIIFGRVSIVDTPFVYSVKGKEAR